MSAYARTAQKLAFGRGSNDRTSSTTRSRSKTRADTPRHLDAPIPPFQRPTTYQREQRSVMRHSYARSTASASVRRFVPRLPVIGRPRGTDTMRQPSAEGDPSTVSVTSFKPPSTIVEDPIPMSQLTMTEFHQPCDGASSAPSSQGSGLAHHPELHQPSASHGSTASSGLPSALPPRSTGIFQGTFPFRTPHRIAGGLLKTPMSRRWMLRAMRMQPSKVSSVAPHSPKSTTKPDETEVSSSTEFTLNSSSSNSIAAAPFGSRITDHFQRKELEEHVDTSSQEKEHVERERSLQEMERNILQKLDAKQQDLDKLMSQLQTKSLGALETEAKGLVAEAKKVAAAEIEKIRLAGENSKLQLLKALEEKSKDVLGKFVEVSLQEVSKISQAGGAVLTKINDSLPKIKDAAAKAVDDMLVVAKSMITGAKRKAPVAPDTPTKSTCNESVCITPPRRSKRQRRPTFKLIDVPPTKTSDVTLTSTSKTTQESSPLRRKSDTFQKRAESLVHENQPSEAEGKRRKTRAPKDTIRTPPLPTGRSEVTPVPTSVTFTRLPFDDGPVELTPSTATHADSKRRCTPLNSTRDLGTADSDVRLRLSWDADAVHEKSASHPKGLSRPTEKASSKRVVSRSTKAGRNVTSKKCGSFKLHGSRKKRTYGTNPVKSTREDIFADDYFNFLSP